MSASCRRTSRSSRRHVASSRRHLQKSTAPATRRRSEAEHDFSRYAPGLLRSCSRRATPPDVSDHGSWSTRTPGQVGGVPSHVRPPHRHPRLGRVRADARHRGAADAAGNRRQVRAAAMRFRRFTPGRGEPSRPAQPMLVGGSALAGPSWAPEIGSPPASAGKDRDARRQSFVRGSASRRRTTARASGLPTGAETSSAASVPDIVNESYAIGGSGTRRGKLRRPSDVAVDPWGNLWVADTGNSRLQRLTPTGKPLTAVACPA